MLFKNASLCLLASLLISHSAWSQVNPCNTPAVLVGGLGIGYGLGLSLQVFSNAGDCFHGGPLQQVGLPFQAQLIKDAGDIDGDGFRDVVISTYSSVGSGSSESTVAVVSSASGVLWQKTGSQAFGASIDGAGDVDGDGRPDVIVGTKAFGADAYAYNGKFEVLSGTDGHTICSVVGTMLQQLGYQVAGIGDFNDDGRSEFLVGAAKDAQGGYTGQAFIYTYNTASHQAQVLYTFANPNGMIGFGSTGLVGGLGNVIVGPKPEFFMTGYAPLGGGQVLRKLLVLTLRSGQIGVALSKDGASMAANAGDVDGDGVDEMIFGYPEVLASNGAVGRIEVYRTSSPAVPLFSQVGEKIVSIGGNTAFGQAISTAGDVDGDGHADVLVGAPQRSTTGNPWPGFGNDTGNYQPNAGKIFVFSPFKGTLLWSYESPTTGQSLGSFVSPAQ